jgi:hypothetical protein
VFDGGGVVSALIMSAVAAMVGTLVFAGVVIAAIGADIRQVVPFGRRGAATKGEQ